MDLFYVDQMNKVQKEEFSIGKVHSGQVLLRNGDCNAKIARKVLMYLQENQFLKQNRGDK